MLWWLMWWRVVLWARSEFRKVEEIITLLSYDSSPTTLQIPDLQWHWRDGNGLQRFRWRLLCSEMGQAAETSCVHLGTLT
jgi:hypothetical protein